MSRIKKNDVKWFLLTVPFRRSNKNLIAQLLTMRTIPCHPEDPGKTMFTKSAEWHVSLGIMMIRYAKLKTAFLTPPSIWGLGSMGKAGINFFLINTCRRIT